MQELLKPSTWISGLQWLLFMFTNTVVIPITVGAAFQLPQSTIVSLMQISFVTCGVACIAQGLLGHGRPIMEGQSGLWWAVMLTLAFTAHAQHLSLTTLGGSLAIGIFISSAINILIGLSGAGFYLAKLFNPGVMGVFMFLFGVKLIAIFTKGMFGLPFGSQSSTASIDLRVSLLSILIIIMMTVISVKAPPKFARYALLIGIIIGWSAYVLAFHAGGASKPEPSVHIQMFPLGAPVWNTGIVVTAIIAGLLNLANTFGALKGTEDMYQTRTTPKEYRWSLTISGVFVGLTGVLGLVPFAPYVSSIGFLNQTRVLKRAPFILGGFLFLVMGVIPSIGRFFALLPLSIGAAVLFVPYLQLLLSSLQFFKRIEFNSINIYRSAIPLFVGIVFMTLPAETFQTIPDVVRPLVSSGLLVGIILALLLENLFSWDHYRPGGEAEA